MELLKDWRARFHPKRLKQTLAKPRNLIGFAKDVSVPETVRLMLADTTITDNGLRPLALRRARTVVDAIFTHRSEI